MDNKLKKLLEIDDYYLYRMLLKEDFLYDKISDEASLIEKSASSGINEAKSLLKSRKRINIDKLALDFGLKYKMMPSDNAFSYFKLAEFQEPDTIIFFWENIKKADDELRKIKTDIFGNVKIKDIIVAHEVYHEIEFKNKNLYTNNAYVSYKKMFLFNKKSKIKTSSEIGAMAFAKVLLKLNINPILINYFLSMAYGKEDIVYEKIMKATNKEK
ncbi:MAG: hypothetical protein PUG67_07685 [Peptoniphilaceae bacterium]|nr:hypothetical protein [Peptoniphilaceae bacterium]MDY6018881.1 hypothetical protein [Anaerococcus sp.]